VTGPPVGGHEPLGLLEAERGRIQRRTLVVLIACQVIGGLGIGIGLAVGALVARDLSGSDAWSGAAVTLVTLGAAGMAIPLARLAGRSGRRAALATGWLVAAGGAVLALAAIVLGWFPLLLVGFATFGAATAANLQSRYAATDLALADHRGRALSIVVWATTLGSVAGPNLAAPAAGLATSLGLPGLAGPFAISAVGFVLSAVALTLWLRPDPLRTAQALVVAPRPALPVDAARPAAGRRAGGGWAAIRASRAGKVSVLVIVTGHAVMVGVMAMTPIHLVHHGASLTIVGLTISLHVAGMYALSPVFGILVDRWGRRPVMLLGLGTLVAACAAAGAAPGGGPLLSLGLVLLGLGWSAGTVAGSTALADAIPLDSRPAAQGVSDSLMGVAGAAAAALSGVVLAMLGFAGLCLLAALLTVPAFAILLRHR
jgi:MFS family permease